MLISISRPARGFALPVVLVTLAALGAVVVGVIPKGTTGIGDAAAVERQVRERLLLEAGLARGILALISPDDPMTESLRQASGVTWTFTGQALTLSIRAESAKLDLTIADPGGLAQAFDRALGLTLGREAFIAALKTREHLTDPTLALPLAERLSSAGTRLRDAVTVYGGRMQEEHQILVTSGGEPSLAFESERPVYTVRARLAGHSRARSVTVLIEPEAHRYAVLERVDLAVDDDAAGQ